MTNSYRPQYLWLLTGPLIGACAGTRGRASLPAVALADPQPLTLGEVAPGSAPVLVGGAPAPAGSSDAVTGFFAGPPFIFLVGRHLTRRVARRRAFVLGALLPPLATVAAFVVLLARGCPGPTATSSGGCSRSSAPAALGGSSRRGAGKDARRKPVS